MTNHMNCIQLFDKGQILSRMSSSRTWKSTVKDLNFLGLQGTPSSFRKLVSPLEYYTTHKYSLNKVLETATDGVVSDESL